MRRRVKKIIQKGRVAGVEGKHKIDQFRILRKRDRMAAAWTHKEKASRFNIVIDPIHRIGSRALQYHLDLVKLMKMERYRAGDLLYGDVDHAVFDPKIGFVTGNIHIRFSIPYNGVLIIPWRMAKNKTNSVFLP